MTKEIKEKFKMFKEMRSCSIHGITEFNISPVKRLNGYYESASCNKCASIRRRKKILERKEFAVNYKGGKCSQCGYNRYIGALEFHHRDPSIKEGTPSKMYLSPLNILRKELDKCDLLCANCHREEHFRLRNE